MKMFSLTCFLGITLSAAAFGQCTNRSPVHVVEVFYENLCSDKPVAECQKIFHDPDILARVILNDRMGTNTITNASAVVWSYFRQHKEVFCFGAGYPQSQVGRCRYLFPASSDGAPFFDRGFSIVIFGKPSPHDKSGIFKELAFPMEKAPLLSEIDANVGYLVDPCGITVNGAFLDYGNEFDRSTNLWNLLNLNKTGMNGSVNSTISLPVSP
jgi:hypothetical protein